jgi:hypothetical protein
MNNQDLQRLLYKHSPFLEKDENLELNTEQVIQLIYSSKVFPLHAVFHEICVIAEKLSLIQIHEYNWIKKNFKCDLNDLDWFFLGYTTPATIIISSCLMETERGVAILKNLNLKTTDERIANLNLYKSKMLNKVFHLTFNHPKTKPQKLIDPIYKLIDENPYNLNYFFQLGIESSRQTANNIASIVESKLTPQN